jgi:hypothetical protein
MALFSQHDLLVNVKQFAIENCPVEIVDLKNGGSFHRFLYVYQRLHFHHFRAARRQP